MQLEPLKGSKPPQHRQHGLYSFQLQTSSKFKFSIIMTLRLLGIWTIQSYHLQHFTSPEGGSRGSEKSRPLVYKPKGNNGSKKDVSSR